MRKKIKERIVFVSICALLGIVLSVQFKTATNTTGKGVSPREREKELTVEYEEVLQRKESLKDELSDLESEIVRYEEKEKKKDTKIESLYDELEKYRMFVGFEPIKGPGIVIDINEPSFQMEIGQEYSIVIANYDLILQLISKLNDLGAEAISINDERYTNYTSLEPGKDFIKVNGRATYLPLKIQAIGNMDRLERGLNVRGNVMWNMQNKYMYDVKIQRQDNIMMQGYNKLLKLDYIEPIESKE